MQRLRFVVLGALLLAGSAALAHEYVLGEIEIIHPVIRATPPAAKVAGGYMLLMNNGEAADRLVGGSADFAGRVEIHEMKMDGDVMKMRELDGGLEIPGGGEVTLEPGGYHLMFMELKQPMVAGDKHDVRLVFEKAGEIAVQFHVEEMQQAGSHRHQ